MDKIEIHYNQRTPEVMQAGEVVSGQRGTVEVQFSFSEEWDEYPIRSASFCSMAAKEAWPLDEKNKVKVPEAVIQYGVRTFTVSAFGTRETEKGDVERYNGKPAAFRVDIGGEIPGEGCKKTATAYEQLLIRVEKKLDANQGTENAGRAMVVGDDGIVRPGDYAGGGGGGGGGITQEKDPTVPAWAKQPNKPTYTPGEIGAQPAGDYALRSEIPTKTSDLKNNSGFITKAAADLVNYYTKSQTYTQEEIDGRISAIPKFSIAVVSALPTSGISDTTIYLVKSGTGTDLYTEYIYAGGAWEILGSQRVDLTGYATETWVSGKLADYLSATELQGAINTALAQAKASGEFDGAPGESGVYVGSGTPPAGTRVQVDPNGNTVEIVDAQAREEIERLSEENDFVNRVLKSVKPNVANSIITEQLASRFEDIAGEARATGIWDNAGYAVVRECANNNSLYFAGKKVPVISGEEYTIKALVKFDTKCTTYSLAVGMEGQTNYFTVDDYEPDSWVQISSTILVNETTGAKKEARIKIEPNNLTSAPIYVKEIMVLHGDEDALVPTEDSNRIADIEKDVSSVINDIGNVSKTMTGLFAEVTEPESKFVSVELSEGDKIEIESAAEKVVHMGKNLFEVGTSGDDYTVKNQLVSVDPNSQQIVLKLISGSSSRVIRNAPIPAVNGDRFAMSVYCDSHGINVGQILVALYDKDGNVLTTGISGSYVEAYKAFVYTYATQIVVSVTNENAAYILAGFRLASSAGIDVGTNVTMRMQVERGSSVSTWEHGFRNEITVENGIATSYAKNGINNIFSYYGEENVRVKHKGLIIHENTIMTRNKEMLPAVQAASRFGYSANGVWNINKQLTLLATTDLHNDLARFMSSISYMEGVPCIDGGVCLGDLQSSHFSDNDGTWFTNAVNGAKKTIYPVIGNHDAGNTNGTDKSATKQQQFDKFFAPILNKISKPSLTTTYYSVDYSYGVTLIVLDCQDVPDTMINETTFAVSRGTLGYSQAQIDWLISTLAAVPAGNHVVIAVHNTLDPATNVDGAWTQDVAMNGGEESKYDYPDMIPAIVDAWQKGTSHSKTYAPIKNTAQPTLTVSADFTSRGAGIFAGYLRGHSHRDHIAKMTNYPEQNIFCLPSTSHSAYQNFASDLPRATSEKSEDCITVFAVDTIARKVKLVRIGSNITFDMVRRDMIAVRY